MIKLGYISFAALFAAGVLMTAPLAAAQQSTEQTDQSEEDWRKSQKKPGTNDIFDDIRNNRSVGTGVTYGPPNPLDSLPEESRRHLIRERAKALATGTPESLGNGDYTPSDAAKTDTSLAEQEKQAWEAIVADLKAEQGQGQGISQGQQGQAPSPSTDGGTGGAGQNQGDSPKPSSSSILRGGSSASVADILSQIKGFGGSGSEPTSIPNGSVGGQGTGPSGPLGSRQNGSASTQTDQNGTSQSGTAPSGSQNSTSQNSAEQSGDGTSAQAGQSAGGANPQDGTGASAQSADSSSAQSGENSGQGSEGEQNAAQAAASNANTPPPVGPLERLKQREQDRENSGQQTNAYDFIKVKE